MKINVGEIIRFGLVGTFAAALHYAIYWVLKHYINVNIAYTIGYVLSFVCNFFLSSYFTFKSKASVKKGVGFIGAHVNNYLMHIILLNFFLYLGVDSTWAPIPVLMIAVPVNFLLVRFVFKHKRKFRPQADVSEEGTTRSRTPQRSQEVEG